MAKNDGQIVIKKYANRRLYNTGTSTYVTLDDLAEMIGTSRETLTKVLNEMRDAGLIDVRERLIWVLDADGLERLKTSS